MDDDIIASSMNLILKLNTVILSDRFKKCFLHFPQVCFILKVCKKKTLNLGSVRFSYKFFNLQTNSISLLCFTKYPWQMKKLNLTLFVNSHIRCEVCLNSSLIKKEF